jgi:tetratricopeptide (TPR) repeat protein
VQTACETSTDFLCLHLGYAGIFRTGTVQSKYPRWRAPKGHANPKRSNVVLQVGVAMLDGELEYRKGNYEEAFRHLETAIQRDDNLVYAEPWPWMQPTRHAYAALLLEQGRIEDAAAAYKADLGFDGTLPRARQHPNNVWALRGYHESLITLGRKDEAGIVGQQLRIALAVADVSINTSCYCRRNPE